MARFPHYLRQNHRRERPSSFVCFDTETFERDEGDGEVSHHLKFGWACYQRERQRGHWCAPEWLRFERISDFWRWVLDHTRPKTCLYLFCHNTSFDLPVLDTFTVLPKARWKLTRAIIDAPPTDLTFKRGPRKLRFLDTLNLWRMPLKDVGRIYDCPKLDMPAPDSSAAEWDRYAKQDVEILRRALLGWWDFLEAEDLGNFRPTLASQSFGSWKHRFMPAGVLVHTDEKALLMEREAYHGGRCECFRLGTYRGKFALCDVNSMYPSVMRGRVFPVRIAFYTERNCKEQFERVAGRLLTVADCYLETDTPAYAKHMDGKLCFPIGKFWTVLTEPEIRFAIERGHLRGMRRAGFYNGAEMFTAFVDALYSRRMAAKRAGNEPLAYNLKKLMNSLYGKFGQRGRTWEDAGDAENIPEGHSVVIDTSTGKQIHYRKLAGLVQAFSDAPESAESCPAIAAFVTAYARLKLWNIIERAGRGHVLYCDTDSVLVDWSGLRNCGAVDNSSALGELAVQARYEEVTLWGPKDYRFGRVEKHKGIRANAKQLSQTRFEQQQWSSLRGLVRLGDLTAPRTQTVVKDLARRYTKGTVTSTNEVTPLTICEPA